MKVLFTCGLFILFNAFSISDDVYEVLASENEVELDNVIAKIDGLESSSFLDAYKGVLLMRKADFATTPKKKLDTFKSGHLLLEAAISNEPDNAEFRFLRLMIQENAPKVLKYHSQIEEDAIIVKDQFKTLSPSLQDQILTYVDQSTVLKPSDFLKK